MIWKKCTHSLALFVGLKITYYPTLRAGVCFHLRFFFIFCVRLLMPSVYLAAN